MPQERYYCPRCGQEMEQVHDMFETDWGPGLKDGDDWAMLDFTYWCEPCDVRLRIVERYTLKDRTMEVFE